MPSSPPVDSITFALPDRAERHTSSDLRTRLLEGSPSPRALALSALVPTLNNASTLASTLRSLAWCDEVVVLDAGSTDATRAIAERFPNVRWHPGSLARATFGHPSEARNDWILVVEPDEVVSTELAVELASLRPELSVAYVVPQETWFRGRNITRCGWASAQSPRLFNRRVSGVVSSNTGIAIEHGHLSTRALRHPLRRSLDDSLAQFLVLSHLEASDYARQRAGKRCATVPGALLRAGWTFLHRYVLRGGWRLGGDGLALCVARAQTRFWQHLLLRDANRERRPAPARPPATR